MDPTTDQNVGTFLGDSLTRLHPDPAKLSASPMSRTFSEDSGIQAMSSSIQLSPSGLQIMNPDSSAASESSVRGTPEGNELSNPWSSGAASKREESRVDNRNRHTKNLSGLGILPPERDSMCIGEDEHLSILRNYYRPSPLPDDGGRRFSSGAPRDGIPADGDAQVMERSRSDNPIVSSGPAIRLVRSSTASTHQSSHTLHAHRPPPSRTIPRRVSPIIEASPSSPVYNPTSSVPEGQDMFAYQSARARLTHRTSPLLPAGFRSPSYINAQSPYIEPGMAFGLTTAEKDSEKIPEEKAEDIAISPAYSAIKRNLMHAQAGEHRSSLIQVSEDQGRQAGIQDWYKHVIGMVRGASSSASR